MAANNNRSGRAPASLRQLWAIAKSPELSLSEDDLHALVYRETKKESLRQLTQGELNSVVRVLQNMKDSAAKGNHTKRTDTGGDPRTVAQRRKIYALCGEIGWNNDNARINGLAKKMFGVDRIEWLNMAQCNKLIEALKKMSARKNGGEEAAHGPQEET